MPTEKKDNITPPPLVEGVDFYWDNGRFVFTEHYHKKRGYCCGNGCRHCPFDYEKVSSANNILPKEC